jgi:hypothetical protein
LKEEDFAVPFVADTIRFVAAHAGASVGAGAGHDRVVVPRCVALRESAWFGRGVAVSVEARVSQSRGSEPFARRSHSASVHGEGVVTPDGLNTRNFHRTGWFLPRMPN